MAPPYPAELPEGDLIDLLNNSPPLEDVWKAIASATRELFEVQATAIYQQADEVYTLLAVSGHHTEALEADQPPIRHLLSHAQDAGYPLLIGAMVARPAIPPPLSVAATATQRELDGRVLLAVPLFGSSFLGMLLLADDCPRSFTSEDVALASALGDQVALASGRGGGRRAHSPGPRPARLGHPDPPHDRDDS